jgi:hypothetical protein
MARECASNVRLKGTARAALCIAAAVGVALVGAPEFVGASEGDDATPGFSGSAAASGIRFTMKMSNLPFTDTPIDAGGPTAQVVADSGGTSQGYAAVPDPGPIVIGGPGLLAGVLAGGVPGAVPPTKLPQEPPGYPFYVRSDAGAAPEQKLGSGPVQLEASSTPGASKSSARTGLQAGESAHAGLATSTAEIGPAGGTVVAKATSRIEGVTVGPLTIGAITSVASETLDPSGKLTPATELRVEGVKVGDVSVGLSPQGFSSGGSTTPVPLNPSLDAALKPSGITVRVVAAQTYPNRVVAPALEVSMPFDSGQFQYKGTITLTLGSAMAAMTAAGEYTNAIPDVTADPGAGAGPGSPVDSPSGPGSAVESPSGSSNASASDFTGEYGADGTTGVPPATSGATDLSDVSLSLDNSGGAGTTSGSSEVGDASATASEPSSAAAPSDIAAGQYLTGSLASRSGSSRLDVSAIYLIGVLATIIAVAGGQAVRRLGSST